MKAKAEKLLQRIFLSNLLAMSASYKVNIYNVQALLFR